MSALVRAQCSDRLRHALSVSLRSETMEAQSIQLLAQDQDEWVDLTLSAIREIGDNITTGILTQVFAVVKRGFDEWLVISSCVRDDAVQFVQHYSTLLFSTCTVVRSPLNLYELRQAMQMLLAGYSMLQLYEAQFPGIIGSDTHTLNGLSTSLLHLSEATTGAVSVKEGLTSLVFQFMLCGNPNQSPLLPRLFQWKCTGEVFPKCPGVLRVRTVDFALVVSFSMMPTLTSPLVTRLGLWTLAVQEDGRLSLVFYDGCEGERMSAEDTLKLVVIQEGDCVFVFSSDSGKILLRGRQSTSSCLQNRPGSADFVVVGGVPSVELSSDLHVTCERGEVIGQVEHLEVENIWGTSFSVIKW